LCDAPRSGLVNKIRLEAKYKYKLAMKHAMANNQIELDDEILNLYLRRDRGLWINSGSGGILVSPIKHVSHPILMD